MQISQTLKKKVTENHINYIDVCEPLSSTYWSWILAPSPPSSFSVLCYSTNTAAAAFVFQTWGTVIFEYPKVNPKGRFCEFMMKTRSLLYYQP